MLSTQYLKTARTLFRVARDMADQTVASRLKTLAEDYERRAEKASAAMQKVRQHRVALPLTES